MTRGILCLAAAAICAAPAAAQKEQLLDVMIVKIKPDKGTELRATVKKMADANRRHKGDHWLTLETAVGPHQTFTFVTPRADFTSIERGMGSFMSAVGEALGKPGMEKLFREFESCLVSSSSEVRRRRWDLSANIPPDGAMKLIGEARYWVISAVKVRPGRGPEFEEQIRTIKTATERAAPDMAVLVSQGYIGSDGPVYYVSIPRTSFGDVDKLTPLARVLGKEGLADYMRASRELVVEASTAIYRVVPELSSAPEEITKAAPEFWAPKPAVAVKVRKAPEEKKQ